MRYTSLKTFDRRKFELARWVRQGTGMQQAGAVSKDLELALSLSLQGAAGWELLQRTALHASLVNPIPPFPPLGI